MKLSNMKILYKILACFALLGLVVAGAIWFATSKMKQIDHNYSTLIEHEMAALQAGLRLNQRGFNFGRLQWQLIALTDMAEMQKVAEEVAANHKDFNAQIEVGKKALPRTAARYDEIRRGFYGVMQDYARLEKAAMSSNNEEAIRLAKPLAQKAVAVRAQISALNGELDKEVKSMSEAATAETASTVMLTIMAIVAALAVVLGLAFMLVQFSISRPLGNLVGELKKLADGDFNVALPARGRKDEIGQISDAAELVAERVGATIANIKIAANEVTGASAEISTATTDLSQRTEEQAASLEETSASMEQMTATVKKNAENAQQANQLAADTREVADRGGDVVAKTVEAMARIEESSRKISDIISVIDEIARQTNLLALNAAVEAARAGEAGRGFAVVASEVRSLAQRSSQAAKDIKDLITSSTGQVKEGVDLVNRAGSALNEIVESIKRVGVVVSEIANASVEQSTGIEQINKALAQMDEVTQQNSALVEENAATAKTLEQQSVSMDERVSFFRLRGNAGQAPVAPAKVERAEPAAEAPAPKRQPVAAKRVAAGGGARGMQSALATAIKQDEWKEF